MTTSKPANPPARESASYNEFEQQRLLALRRYGLLDTPPEKIFDGITEAIAAICDTPIALISLIDEQRQWFKSAYGLTVKETARDIAFCDHAICEPAELMIVEDAQNDARFRDNPLVLEQPNIRFYAGQPLVSDDGFPLGTLCVIDQVPRVLNERQKSAIASLASTVTEIFVERHRIEKIALDRSTVEDALHEKIALQSSQLDAARAALDSALSVLPFPCLAMDSSNELLTVNPAWREALAPLSGEQAFATGAREKPATVFEFIANHLVANERDFREDVETFLCDEPNRANDSVSASLHKQGRVEIYREHRHAEYIFVALKNWRAPEALGQ